MPRGRTAVGLPIDQSRVSFAACFGSCFLLLGPLPCNAFASPRVVRLVQLMAMAKGVADDAAVACEIALCGARGDADFCADESVKMQAASHGRAFVLPCGHVAGTSLCRGLVRDLRRLCARAKLVVDCEEHEILTPPRQGMWLPSSTSPHSTPTFNNSNLGVVDRSTHPRSRHHPIRWSVWTGGRARLSCCPSRLELL